MDQMVTHYTSKRSTRRWTYAFFFNMLDIMALAAFCICKEQKSLQKNDARREFLGTLSNTLVLANIESRMRNQRVMAQFTTRLAIEAYFGRKLNLPTNAIAAQTSGADTLVSKKDCRLCLQEADKVRRKTRFFCQACSNPVCQQHSKIAYTCFSCISEAQ